MTVVTGLEIFGASVLAGAVGSVAGVGGGIIVIPALTIVFGVDIRLAVGASIVSVIATSSGAAVAYLRDELVNVRIGMLLQLATAAGAVAGALLAGIVHPALLFLLLGVVLLGSALQQMIGARNELPPVTEASPLARRLKLAGEYEDLRLGKVVAYAPRRVPLGFAMMGVAGLLSGLLGIGSGALKVIALDTAMGLPMKVSSATSNFMIGVTAAASAGIYIGRGDVDPRLAVPVALGVLLGAAVGARVLPHLTNRQIRWVFVPILLAIGLQTIARGLGLAI
jgi:uncharacterized membrane protein YfcA